MGFSSIIPSPMRAGSATLVALAVWLVASASSAQAPGGDTAQAHFDRGAKLYNLGHFQEAIPQFEKAYELDPSPIFLFNIAQSHRQLGNTERALFFYRRYLEQAPNAANRADVERRMKELRAALQPDGEPRPKAPAGGSAPAGGPGLVDTPALGASDETGPPVGAPAPPGDERHPWSVSAALGVAFASMSGSAVDLPAMLAARVEGAYAFLLPAGELAVGVDLGYARLPYTRRATDAHPALEGTSGGSAFWGLLASARYLVPVTPALKLGAGLAGGVLFWSGLDEGNPFTLQGVAPSGAIALPSAAVSLRGEYRLSDALFVLLAPELVWSTVPSSAGNAIAGVISSVTRIDVAAGVGVQF